MSGSGPIFDSPFAIQFGHDASTLPVELSSLTALIKNDGIFTYSSTIKIELYLPDEFILKQNYPNSFNPSNSILYALNSMQFVSLKDYDVLGNEVAVIVYKVKHAGNYKLNFNAPNLSS